MTGPETPLEDATRDLPGPHRGGAAEASDAANAADPTAPLRQGLARKLVVFSVLAVLVYAALVLYGDAKQFPRAFEGIDVKWIAFGLLASTLNFLVRFARWTLFLDRLDIRLGIRESASVFLAGFSMTITPGKVGEVLKALLIRHSHGVPIRRTVPVILAERMTDVLALVALTSLGGLTLPQGERLALGGAVVVTLGLLLGAWPPLGRWLLRLVERLPGLSRFKRPAHETLGALLEVMRPRTFVFGTLLGTCAWATHGACLYLVARAFAGVELGFLASLLAYAGPLLAGALVMLPAGLGLTEASMAGLLSSLGGAEMTASKAAAITLVVRAITLWWAVLLGFLGLLWWRTLHPETRSPR